jgi:hypothetical protein
MTNQKVMMQQCRSHVPARNADTRTMTLKLRYSAYQTRTWTSTVKNAVAALGSQSVVEAAATKNTAVAKLQTYLI